MTEADWLACDDPAPMLAYLLRAEHWRDRNPTAHPPRVSGRRLRLFACACCRQVWPWLTDPHGRRAVEVAERFADGEATEAERAAADLAAEWPYPPVPKLAAANVCAFPGEIEPTVRWVRHWLGRLVPPAAQIALLREVVGNPWRPVDRGRLGIDWYGGDAALVIGMAATIYERRSFEDLPVLTDALEEAGCTEADLLGHLRSPGPHVRGCWALDVLLGKER